MAFPTVAAQAVTNNQGNNASFTMPSFTAGQLLLGITGSLTAPTGASTASGGTWTLVGTTNLSSTSFLRVWAKIAQTSDTLTLAGGFSSGGYVLAIDAWSGNVADIGYAAITSSIDPPNLNMTTARDYLWLTGAYNYQNNITAAPTNYTNLTGATFNTSPASDHKFALARRTLNASAENPGVFTATTSFPAAWTIAITPVLLTVWDGAATFAGAGSMAVPAVPVHPGAVGWSGAGSMAVAAVPTHPAAASWAGAGSLAVDAARVRLAAVSWAGEGQFSAGGPGSQFSGSGSLTVAGTRVQPGAVNWAGAGAFTIGGTRIQPGLIGWAGAGLLTVTGIRIRPSTAGWSGSGSMSIDGTKLGPLVGTWRRLPYGVPDGPILGSTLAWDFSTFADGQDVVVRTSVDNGATFQVATNYGPIPRLVQDNTSIRAVLVEVTFSRAIGSDPSPRFHWLRAFVQNERSVVELVSLGAFAVTDAEVDDGPDGVGISLTGADLSWFVSQAKWQSIRTFPKDTNLADVVRQILIDRYPGAQFGDWATTAQGALATLTVGAQPTNDPFADARKIAASYGCELYVNYLGKFCCTPPADPEIDPIVHTFTDQARPTLVHATRKLTATDTANYIVVEGESVNGVPSFRAETGDNDPYSPSYYLGKAGLRVKRVVTKLVGDAAAALVMAQAMLLQSKGAVDTVDFEAVSMLALQEGDTVMLDRSVSKLSGRYLLDSFNITSKGATQTFAGRRKKLDDSQPAGDVGGLDGDTGGGGGGGGTTTNFTLAFSACINANASAAGSLTHIKNANPDYFAILGDFWYKDGSTPTWVADWTRQTGYSNFAALLAGLPNPMIVGVSDHDFGYENNSTGGDMGATLTANFNAAYRTKWGSSGAGVQGATLPTSGIYRTWVVGRIRFVLLDMMTFKSKLTASDNSSKTMLGSAQKTWYKNILSTADEPLIVVFGDGQIPGPKEAAQDEWRGYSTERGELATAVGASSATVLYLNGDTHSLAYGHDQYGYDRCWQAAPLHNTTKVKAAGVGYDETYPTNDDESDTEVSELYAIVSFTDDGSSITATYTGYEATTVRLTDTITVTG